MKALDEKLNLFIVILAIQPDTDNLADKQQLQQVISGDILHTKTYKLFLSLCSLSLLAAFLPTSPPFLSLSCRVLSTAASQANYTVIHV